MKIALITASPRIGRSASGAFAGELGELLKQNAEVFSIRLQKPELGREPLEEMDGCDALVFFFPLYVDGIPSHLLRVLEELEAHFQGRQGGKPRIYGVVNCGFYEGVQNKLAIKMLRHWSRRAGCPWGMGLGIGCGPMLQSMGQIPAGRGPKKNLGDAFSQFTAAILDGREAETVYVGPNFPRRFYITAAHMGWRAEARQNGLRRRDLYRA